ncbi:MAG: hypothetical protein AAF628_14685 [Planctomycetota bacterium]
MTPLRLLCLIALVAPTISAQTNLRAWHRDGQTFLVWQHARLIPPPTYDIHAAATPITSLTSTNRIGRVFASNGANTRLALQVPGSRWVLPGPGTTSTTVGAREAYFVSTASAVGIRYFAVAPTGAVGAPPVVAGPVDEALDPVRSHLQYSDARGRVYGHWVDGSIDPNGGRANYPVMGNEWENGLGFNFGVWDPPAGATAMPPTGFPVVTILHGGFGNFWNHAPGIGEDRFGHPDAALLFTPDDFILGQGASAQTFWLGHWAGYNRFTPSPPPDGEIIIDYTRRRVLWELDHLSTLMPVDTDRIAVTGISMGGVGSGLYAHTAPDRFAVAAPYVAPFELGRIISQQGFQRAFGTAAQALRVAVPGNPEVLDYFDPVWRMNQRAQLPGAGSWPHVRWVFGRNDTRVLWSDIAPRLSQINDAAVGDAIYWDERAHTMWTSGTFWQATRIRAPYLTAYRASQSWPALLDVDTAPTTPGRQPDPGNGSPSSGTPSGTWGGYIEWEPALVHESPNAWEVGLRLIRDRADASEISGLAEIQATVRLARRRVFLPASGTALTYELRRRADGAVLQSGSVQADGQREITIPGLRIRAADAVLRVVTPTGAAARPLALTVRQPMEPGSLSMTVRGLDPLAPYAVLLGLTPALDGIGTGWLAGLAPSAAELQLLVPPFVGFADPLGRASLSFPAGTVPSGLTLEALAVDLNSCALRGGTLLGCRGSGAVLTVFP